MHTKTEGNTFTKEIGQTVYGVRYYFNEDAKETMQEKINRMLVYRSKSTGNIVNTKNKCMSRIDVNRNIVKNMICFEWQVIL